MSSRVSGNSLWVSPIHKVSHFLKVSESRVFVELSIMDGVYSLGGPHHAAWLWGRVVIAYLHCVVLYWWGLNIPECCESDDPVTLKSLLADWVVHFRYWLVLLPCLQVFTCAYTHVHKCICEFFRSARLLCTLSVHVTPLPSAFELVCIQVYMLCHKRNLSTRAPPEVYTL